MTLHKIIITHKTFHNYKKILFKHFKHMMQSKPTPLLCRHLINYCANTRGVTAFPPKRNLVPRLQKEKGAKT